MFMSIHFLYEKPIVELNRLRYLISNKVRDLKKHRFRVRVWVSPGVLRVDYLLSGRNG